MVLAVMVFTKPNDREGIRVVFIMRYNMATTTDHAAAAGEHTPLDQLLGSLADFPSQENQGVVEFLSLPDLPFGKERRRLLHHHLSISACTGLAAVVFALPVKMFPTQHAT
jgi:hypothetical protein